jgi:uncharacterized protein (TIGR03083 family)
VPTCPEWDTKALVAHQAMVHRWAAAHVGGADPDASPTDEWIASSVDDLGAYYREGLAELMAALRAASPDLEALRFLNDAPAPREFWARRQAHETTIHMVDAVAALLVRVPTIDEADIDAALAVDGIDELLRGFFTRGPSPLYSGTEYTIAVIASDADRRWTIHVGPQLETTVGGGRADATIEGPAAAVYLALWNRGDAVAVSGRPEILDRWQLTQRVSWR